jgi:transposase InsO family protein
MEQQEIQVKEMIQRYRRRMPRIGGIKLYDLLKEELSRHHIKMGRDKFYSFLKAHELLIPRTKRAFITTNSKHFFYKSPNRIKGLTISHSEQVWVNDITYIKTAPGHAYLALVTDAYSKKIMGYSLQNNMKVEMVKSALQMALKNRSFTHASIIHHSDRGIQYCCPDFTDFAEKSGMVLSTTQQYDPYENAVAERINGILKSEFGLGNTLPSIKIAQKMVKQAVEIYNNERPHFSLNLAKPAEAHIAQIHPYKSYSKRKASISTQQEC